jgi:hypothetical protein
MTKMRRCYCCALVNRSTPSYSCRMRTPSRHIAGWLGCALAVAISLALMAGAATAHAQIPDTAQASDAAQRDLQKAQRAVAEARSGASNAKTELEAAALASSLIGEPTPADRARSGAPGRDHQVASEPALKSPAATLAKRAVAAAVAAEIETLEQLIADLHANRAELLQRLTTAHPLIVNADLRLEEHELQLATLTRGAAADSKIGDPTPSVKPETSNLPVATAAVNGQISRRLESALGRWEQAQHTLEAAMNAESTAVERLVASLSRTPANSSLEVETKTAATSPTSAAATETGQAARRKRRGSQPLVLAALIIALVVAAIGSVKLARTVDESVFAGADDAAATLALPVVGVIPAAAPALAYRTFFERHRTLTFLAQLMLTVLVFAAVAYCVQNLALL